MQSAPSSVPLRQRQAAFPSWGVLSETSKKLRQELGGLGTPVFAKWSLSRSASPLSPRLRITLKGLFHGPGKRYSWVAKLEEARRRFSFQRGRRGVYNGEFSEEKAPRQGEAGACGQDPARRSRMLSGADLFCEDLKTWGHPSGDRALS